METIKRRDGVFKLFSDPLLLLRLVDLLGLLGLLCAVAVAVLAVVAAAAAAAAAATAAPARVLVLVLRVGVAMLGVPVIVRC